jgi:hypothetical protein
MGRCKPGSPVVTDRPDESPVLEVRKAGAQILGAFARTDLIPVHDQLLKVMEVAGAIKQTPDIRCDFIESETVAPLDIESDQLIAELCFQQLFRSDVMDLHPAMHNRPPAVHKLVFEMEIRGARIDGRSRCGIDPIVSSRIEGGRGPVGSGLSLIRPNFRPIAWLLANQVGKRGDVGHALWRVLFNDSETLRFELTKDAGEPIDRIPKYYEFLADALAFWTGHSSSPAFTERY